MAESGVEMSYGPIHAVKLSESQELSVAVPKDEIKCCPMNGNGAQNMPANIVAELSGAGSLDEEAKDLLAKAGEVLCADILEKVKGQLNSDLPANDGASKERLDKIISMLDSVALGEFETDSTLKKRAKESRSAEQFLLEALERERRRRDREGRSTKRKFKICLSDDDSFRIRSYSDSASVSTSSAFNDLESSSFKKNGSSQSRSYASRTSTTTVSENSRRKPRGKSSKYHGSKRGGEESESASTLPTEDTTTTTATETDSETATGQGSSTMSGQTVVPKTCYSLRPLKSTSKKMYQDFLYLLRRANEDDLPNGFLKFLEASSRQDSPRTEQDLFCEYLKIRLTDLECKEMRKVVFKIHQVLEQPIE